jgi:hypothetical protein
MLGARSLHTVQDRAAYVAQRLRTRTRTRKALEMPHWSREELSERGKNMRGRIEGMLEMKRWLLTRIGNAEMVACGYKAEPIRDAFSALMQKLASEILKDQR